MSKEVSTDLIKKLREETGVSIMQCRKALEEASGDLEKAKLILRKKSSALAEKKADRSLGAGTVAAYVHNTGVIASILELSSETDFVSGNADFKKLAYELAMHVSATKPEYLKREDVPAKVVDEMREVFLEEVKDKPASMRDKIVDGKIEAFFKERILLEQAFIKNPQVTISELLSGAVQKFGEKIEIARFACFAVNVKSLVCQ